ncbi:hypothetical protein [Micromonospora auratinigra]|uniref:hypothetical protein n=1 Tax=Micromonospora auratinigra TaxID=261654 RepID=UPI000B80ECA6|nr:hypothetical protein [Micromonospora auratinigra]
MGAAVLGALLVAGCDDGDAGTDTAAGTTAATPQATGTDAGTGLPADAKRACTKLDATVKTTQQEAATAARVGGDAAVGGKYLVGSARVYEYVGTSSDALNEAAKQLGNAMSELAQAYTANDGQKPNTANLDAAVAKVQAVCAAG